MEAMQKKLVVVGGPNGSGKSTFADEYVHLYSLKYLGKVCTNSPQMYF